MEFVVRVRRFSVAISAITCLALAGWSCFPSQGADAASGRPGVATKLAAEAGFQANRQAAEREAQHLLAVARVPPGATRLNDARACSTAAAEMSKPAVTSVVRKSRFWRVSEPRTQLASWLQSHSPKGLRLTVWMPDEGPWGYDGKTTAQWSLAELQVGAARLSASRSVICAVSVVIWLDPRPWPDNAAGPRIHLTVAGGCLSSDAKLVGVTNPGTNLKTRLLPAATPTGAVVCAYKGMNASPSFGLAHQSRLGATAARRLAALVAAIPLSHEDGGTISCPSDDGSAAVFVFAYRVHSDVDIWADSGGCGFAANGYIRSGFDFGLYKLVDQYE